MTQFLWFSFLGVIKVRSDGNRFYLNSQNHTCQHTWQARRFSCQKSSLMREGLYLAVDVKKADDNDDEIKNDGNQLFQHQTQHG